MSKESVRDNPQRVEQLYKQEHYRLIGVALTNGAPPDVAEDLTQDAWLSFLEQDSFDWSLNPPGYLATSVHNKTMSYHRRHNAHPSVSLTPDDSDLSNSKGKAIPTLELLQTIADERESVESQAIRNADSVLLKAQLETVMTTLPPVDQEIFQLTAEGWNGAEIAVEIGISHGNVRQRKFRAQKKTQPQLTDFR